MNVDIESLACAGGEEPGVGKLHEYKSRYTQCMEIDVEETVYSETVSALCMNAMIVASAWKQVKAEQTILTNQRQRSLIVSQNALIIWGTGRILGSMSICQSMS